MSKLLNVLSDKLSGKNVRIVLPEVTMLVF